MIEIRKFIRKVERPSGTVFQMQDGSIVPCITSYEEEVLQYREWPHGCRPGDGSCIEPVWIDVSTVRENDTRDTGKE